MPKPNSTKFHSESMQQLGEEEDNRVLALVDNNTKTVSILLYTRRDNNYGYNHN